MKRCRVNVPGKIQLQIDPSARESAGEERFVLLGRSDRRRLLVVMFTEHGEAIRLISARRATPRERRRHEEGES